MLLVDLGRVFGVALSNGAIPAGSAKSKMASGGHYTALGHFKPTSLLTHNIIYDGTLETYFARDVTW